VDWPGVEPGLPRWEVGQNKRWFANGHPTLFMDILMLYHLQLSQSRRWHQKRRNQDCSWLTEGCALTWINMTLILCEMSCTRIFCDLQCLYVILLTLSHFFFCCEFISAKFLSVNYLPHCFKNTICFKMLLSSIIHYAQKDFSTDNKFCMV